MYIGKAGKTEILEEILGTKVIHHGHATNQ